MKVAAVNEEFSIEREYVDNIPPTPTTSRRLKKCASSCENIGKDETLLFRAYTKAPFKILVKLTVILSSMPLKGILERFLER